MKNLQKYSAVALSGAVSLMASASSFAAIAVSDLTAPLAGITTDAGTVFTAVLPVLLTVLGLTIGYKLVKRFVGSI